MEVPVKIHRRLLFVQNKKKIQTFLDLIFKPKTIAQVNNPLSVCEELLLVVLDPYITKH